MKTLLCLCFAVVLIFGCMFAFFSFHVLTRTDVERALRGLIKSSNSTPADSTPANGTLANGTIIGTIDTNEIASNIASKIASKIDTKATSPQVSFSPAFAPAPSMHSSEKKVPVFIPHIAGFSANRDANVKKMLSMFSNAQVVVGVRGLDDECLQLLYDNNIRIAKTFYRRDTVDVGKIGVTCAWMKVLLACQSSGLPRCVWIEDDIQLSAHEVATVERVALSKVFSTPLCQIGIDVSHSGMGDTIDIIRADKIGSIFTMLQKGIDDPSDLMFNKNKFYTRGEQIGGLINKNDATTSVIRTQRAMPITEYNTLIEGIHDGPSSASDRLANNLSPQVSFTTGKETTKTKIKAAQLEPKILCPCTGTVIKEPRKAFVRKHSDCRNNNILCSAAIYECPDSKLMFTHPIPNKIQLAELYKHSYSNQAYLENGHMRVLTQSDFIRKYSGVTFKNKKIVELGCAGGHLLNEFRGNGNELICFEGDPDMHARFQDNYKDYDLAKLMPTLFDGNALPASSVDLLMSSHVVEHISEPCVFLRQAMAALKPGGLMFHEIPQQRRHDGLHPLAKKQYGEYHMTFWTKESVDYIFRLCGFERVHLEVFSDYKKVDSSGKSKWIRTLFRKPKEIITPAPKVHSLSVEASAEQWSAATVIEKIRSVDFNDILELHTGAIPKYHTCSVVGSSPALLKYDMGAAIDLSDAVFRSNKAPTKGYEKAVGRRTTVRGYNPVTTLGSLPADFDVSIQHIDPDFIRSPNGMRETWKSQKDNGKVNVFLKGLGIELCNYMAYFAVKPMDKKVHEHFWDWFRGERIDYWHPQGKSIPQFSPVHCSTGLVTLLDAMLLCDEVTVFGYSGCEGFDTSFGKEHYYKNAGAKDVTRVQKRYASAQTSVLSMLLKNDTSIKCGFVNHDQECRELSQLGLEEGHDCAVVGSSGILKGSGNGAEIDKHDVVLRMNLAPVAGYEADVGSRTDIRFINCPSWAAVSKETNNEKISYLRKIDPKSNARLISCNGPTPSVHWSFQFRNECLYRKPIFTELQMKEHLAQRGKRYEPAFGFETVVRALYSCSRVHIYGMSDPSEQNVPYHYYETGSEWKKEWKSRHNGGNWDFYKAHNFQMENNKLKEWESKSFIEFTRE